MLLLRSVELILLFVISSVTRFSVLSLSASCGASAEPSSLSSSSDAAVLMKYTGFTGDRSAEQGELSSASVIDWITKSGTDDLPCARCLYFWLFKMVSPLVNFSFWL